MGQSPKKWLLIRQRLLLAGFCAIVLTVMMLIPKELTDDGLLVFSPGWRGPTVELFEDKHVHFLCADFQSPDRLPCLCYYDSRNVPKNTTIPKATSINDLQLVRLLGGRCAMTINAQGRLGNLMGKYAILYALAKRNGRPAFMQKAMATVLQQHFNLSMPVLGKILELAKGVWTHRLLRYWMEDEYAHINDTFLFITGYPYSWTYFHHLRGEILREFAFSQDVIDAVHRKLLKVREGRRHVTFVGVHARRSDYLRVFKTPENRGVIADADYFSKATNYFRSRYPDCVFVVASDDLQWCRENLDNSLKDVYFAGHGDIVNPILDMALLSKCNHSIITIGTFGFWAAYLAGGETVHLTNYSKPGVYFDQVVKPDKLYLPNWVPIAANRSSIL